MWILLKHFDPDQPKHASQAYHDRHSSPPVAFLFQESLLYTSILLRRNVLARISLRGLRKLICVDTLRRVHNVGFIVEQLIYIRGTMRVMRPEGIPSHLRSSFRSLQILKALDKFQDQARQKGSIKMTSILIVLNWKGNIYRLALLSTDLADCSEHICF